MYESFFGLTQRPFAFAPLANRYFPASSVDAARQVLARIIDRGEGAGLLVGAPGTGKTLLLHVLAEQFAERFGVVLLRCGQIASRRELWQAVLFELKLPYQGLDEGELRLLLTDYALRGDAGLEGLLLLVDEAHTLPMTLLEELRMATNLARRGEPLVRLVLSGTMALEELFAHPRLEAFAQRLAARCYLEPFDRAETSDYVRFQIAVAGGQAESVFAPDAYETIYRATGGVPRLVNQLCDHALLQAYTDELRPVGRSAIEEAWSDLQQLPTQWSAASPEPVGATAPGGTPGSIVEFGELSDDHRSERPPGNSHRGTISTGGDGHTAAGRSVDRRADPDVDADVDAEGDADRDADGLSESSAETDVERPAAADAKHTAQADALPDRPSAASYAAAGVEGNRPAATAQLDALQQHVGSLMALENGTDSEPLATASPSSAPDAAEDPTRWFAAERDEFDDEQPLVDHYAALDALRRKTIPEGAVTPQLRRGHLADEQAHAADDPPAVRLQVIVDPYADLHDDGLDDAVPCPLDDPQAAAERPGLGASALRAEGYAEHESGTTGGAPLLRAVNAEAAAQTAAGAADPEPPQNDPYAFDLPVFDGAEELVVADHYGALDARTRSVPARSHLRTYNSGEHGATRGPSTEASASAATQSAASHAPRSAREDAESVGRKAQVVRLQCGALPGPPADRMIVVQDAPEAALSDDPATLSD